MWRADFDTCTNKKDNLNNDILLYWYCPIDNWYRPIDNWYRHIDNWYRPIDNWYRHIDNWYTEAC